jgi:uncharacterized protein (DUF58 family)
MLTRHGNRVGAMLYGSGVDTVIPPAAAAAMCCTCCTHAEQRPRHRSVEAGHAAARPAEVGRQPDQAALDRVRGLRLHQRARLGKAAGPLAQRHEVVAVRVLDPLELELPDLGLLTLRDAETGEQLLVDTHDAGFRKRFARIAAQREADCARRWPRPASTRWNSPPTPTWSTPSSASSTCASAAAQLSSGSLPSHLRHAA